MSGHPNVERMLRGFGAFVQRDLPSLHELFADDVRWTIPGASLLAGTYEGLPAVLEMLGTAVVLTGGTYDTDVQWVVADDDRAVAFYRARGERAGRELDIDQLLLCRFVDGRIVEVLAVPVDQARFDAFWS